MGDQYRSGQILAPVLGAAAVFRALHYCVGEMLVAQGRAGSRVVAQLAAVALNIATLVVLVPLWGTSGLRRPP